MKTILLATDGSASAARATREAVKLAQATGAALHVVTAWSLPRSAFSYDPFAVLATEMAEVEQEKAKQALVAAVEAVKQAGLDPEPILRRGEAGTVICEVANEINAELVVVGSRGWNPVKSLLLGSTSLHVLHHADSPVLIARADAGRP
jgi:nucleotide-binding universal stress UspA family protein